MCILNGYKTGTSNHRRFHKPQIFSVCPMALMHVMVVVIVVGRESRLPCRASGGPGYACMHKVLCRAVPCSHKCDYLITQTFTLASFNMIHYLHRIARIAWKGRGNVRQSHCCPLSSIILLTVLQASCVTSTIVPGMATKACQTVATGDLP